jgi:hypothetical protein
MRSGYLLVTAALLTLSSPAAAQQSGHWHGVAALVSVDQKTVKLEDQPNHVVNVNEEDGAIHNADGKPFLDKARYQVLALTDSAVGGRGYKTFTEADGSKVFAKFTVTALKLPEIDGTFEFTGGTGKYIGITGNGKFHLVRVSDKAAWDELVGDYTIPAAAH